MQPSPTSRVSPDVIDSPAPPAPFTDVHRPSTDERLSALFRTHYVSLVRLAAMLLDDPGHREEVVQEAFVRLHGKLSRLREPDAAVAWGTRRAPVLAAAPVTGPARRPRPLSSRRRRAEQNPCYVRDSPQTFSGRSSWLAAGPRRCAQPRARTAATAT